MFEKQKSSIYLTKEQLHTINTTLSALADKGVTNLDTPAKLLVYLCETNLVENLATINNNSEYESMQEKYNTLLTQFQDLEIKHDNAVKFEAELLENIDGLQKEIESMKDGMKVSNTLEEKGKTVATNVQPIVKNRKKGVTLWFQIM